eukprot:3894793-Prymnesium_polylepis.1
MALRVGFGTGHKYNVACTMPGPRRAAPTFRQPHMAPHASCCSFFLAGRDGGERARSAHHRSDKQKEQTADVPHAHHRRG